MNSALVRFVADYLANHAARSDAGDGVPGRLQVDAGVAEHLELRFEPGRCHVSLTSANSADCHVTIPWPRLAKVDGDRILGERATAWLHDSEFCWHVYKRVPEWQPQANLGGKACEEIRAFAADVYDSFDLAEPGRLYWFPSWLIRSGRNSSRDEDTRCYQGSVGTP